MKKPSILWVCFDAHQADGRVWAIRVGNRWHRTKAVWLYGTFVTRYRPQGAQPKAYLQGVGHIVKTNNCVEVYSDVSSK